MRRTSKIDVGVYEGQVGFTVNYENGEREHFLFRPAVAEELARCLFRAVATMPALPGDDIRVTDHCELRIHGGENGEAV